MRSLGVFGTGTATELSVESLVGVETAVLTRPVWCKSLSCTSQLVEKEKKKLGNHGKCTNHMTITPNTECYTYYSQKNIKIVCGEHSQWYSCRAGCPRSAFLGHTS